MIKSLERYFFYVINVDNFSFGNIGNLFIIDEDVEINQIILDTLLSTREFKVIFFGKAKISSANYVNLSDYSNLKKNIVTSLMEKNINPSQFLLIKEFHFKIKLFFKGHGEESLFNGLNWTRYYLINGINLLNRNNLNLKEFKNVYLKPGLQYWDNFKNRFNKYEIYLHILGYKIEVEQVKSLISDFQDFVDCLGRFSKENNQEINELNIKKYVDYLKQIDYIFMKIYENITSQYESIQHISR